jgi:hypothetical protein
MGCSHPNILRGADGVLRCLTCKQAVEPIPTKAEAEPEKKPAKRTRKAKAD